ncbi:MAG: hypothetical protein K1X57_02300 [Gemmataceae bacterium]|nr:hypothetical protein [Gemmataceae bacterium]
MGFLSGRVSYTRFRVKGRTPGTFGEAHLEKLADYAAGKQKAVSADGVEVGWVAGDHVLDTEFDLAKNVVNDALAFQLRIDQNKPPADLLRAYTAIELKGLSQHNPSGHPSARQKREAREAARERLENDSKDGRFLRRKLVDMMWDGRSNEMLISSSAVTVLDRLYPLFHDTFSAKFEPITAGTLAFDLAEPRQQGKLVDDARPSAFVPGPGTGDVAWVPDETSRDFLGNEFLLWLWNCTDRGEDTFGLSDGSSVAVMLARTLTLEDPRGQSGRGSLTSDGPARLPEARRAVQSGKLPRKCGLTVVRQADQYEFTLSAETLGVSAAKLPAIEGDSEYVRRSERVDKIRHLIETMDLLYDAFGQVRCSDGWTKELHKMQKWLRGADE